jgi:hypothetical protein
MSKKKVEAKKLTRNEIVTLYSVIRDIKSGELKKEVFIKYIMLRVKIKALVEDFEKAREEISAQTKPEGWVDGDCRKEWDRAFQPVMAEWLAVETDIDTRILTFEECCDLIKGNPELVGSEGDVIVGVMGKMKKAPDFT